MSAHKHTPGPWRTAGAQNNGAILVRGSEATSEVAIALQNDRRYSAEANARLIAAAPELLEAAMAFVAPFDGIEVVKGSDIAKARAAIAKATGEPA